MGTVSKQLWFVSVIMLLLSAGHGHSLSAAIAHNLVAEPANINSPSPQLRFSVSGRVSIILREEGVSGRPRVAGISVVRMTFTRVSGTGPVPSPVETDENGNWSQSGFVPFESVKGDSIAILYRATPTKSGLAFNPPFITFKANKLLTPLPDLNFEARQDLVSASGKVTTQSGKPVPGVSVSVVPQGGQARTVTTDSQGEWRISLTDASSTLRATPLLELFRFTPAFRDFTKQSASQLDFKLPDTFGIGGALKSDQQGTAPPAPSATVSFELISGSGATPLSVRADASGNFRQNGFTTGCTYRIKVVNITGRVCATREVSGEFNGRINCL